MCIRDRPWRTWSTSTCPTRRRLPRAGVDRRAQGLGRGRGGHRRARRADLPLSSSGTSASTVAASNRAYSHALPPPAPCRRRSRMPIATPDVYAEMLTRAKDNAFAYPGINVTSSQTLNAALRGFAEAESDGIVQVSTGGAEFLSGTTVKDMVLGAGRNLHDAVGLC